MFSLRSLIYTFIFSIVLLIPTCTIAQEAEEVPDEQIESFLSKAKSSGLSQEQIEAMALERGYSMEFISKMKSRISKLQSGNYKPQSDTSRVDRGQSEESRSELLKSTKKSKSLDTLRLSSKVFGVDFFQRAKLTFEPNLKIPTPKNYILGTDDELSIDISGYAYQHYTAKVSPEGTIRLENLSPIYISGLTIEKAKEVIVNRLKTLFAGLSSSGSLTADVTLSKIRSIKVIIIGEAFLPGSYTLPSLATAFNAIYACGGPTDNGSLRTIEIHRNGKLLRVVDFYSFLLHGNKKDDIALQDQDVIRIPFYESRVEFQGEVKNPKIYEIKWGETLQQALSFAGGFSDSAYTKNIALTRVTAIDRKIINIDQANFATFIPQKGDIFKVGKVLNRFENIVYINGAVFRPGEYSLDQAPTLVQLIKKAEGLKEDAFKNRAYILRNQESYSPEIITVDLDKILKSEAPDIQLKRQDSVMVKFVSEIHEARTVQIMGAVNKPQTVPYVDNLTVGTLILAAGGFKDGAIGKRIEIARRSRKDDDGTGKKIEVINLEVKKNLEISPEENKFKLEPFDMVFIRDAANYEAQKTVTISGQVNYPGVYAIQSKDESVASLIKRAGGTLQDAYLSGATFYRKGKIVAVNLSDIVGNESSPNNLILQNGDNLTIPVIEQIVTLNGQVLNPTSVAYRPDFTFRDYIAQGGGFTDSANTNKTYVRYANGLTDRTRSFLGFKKYPKVERGMDIYVPVRRKYRWTPAERIAVSSAIVSIATIMVTIVRLL